MVTAGTPRPLQSWSLSALHHYLYLLVTEQRTRDDETQTPSEEDDVEAVTHTTSCGRDEAAIHADVIAEDDERRYGLRERDLRAAAHASVLEDWTEYGKERPPQIRFEIWVDPFSRAEPVNEMEERFLKTVKIRERTIRWKQGESR